ncbi:Myb domain, plants [Ostreococcus tauri]|uniref:Myb domain, plants n=1 Tax=Ostreococcus tauri TaxID=70448 RepID=A0A096PAD6_OSTTA|nr:Myb domain, plants [Ostreococcus tauri]CEG01238.1 Myb domain, plants [Ostreococcus tauri]|eukprot:XP_003080049.2 Myb domain, plants [Ostreococcus tauri]
MSTATSISPARFEDEVKDAAKKPRKPYVRANAPTTWTANEHERFVEAIRLHQRDWRAVTAHVRTKTPTQIRSHAQKYFAKLRRDASGEAPPRTRGRRVDLSRLAVKLHADARGRTEAMRVRVERTSDGSFVDRARGAYRRAARDRAETPNLSAVYGFLAAFFDVDPTTCDDDNRRRAHAEASARLDALRARDRGAALDVLANLRRIRESSASRSATDAMVAVNLHAAVAAVDAERACEDEEGSSGAILSGDDADVADVAANARLRDDPTAKDVHARSP